LEKKRPRSEVQYKKLGIKKAEILLKFSEASEDGHEKVAVGGVIRMQTAARGEGD
jgi:hypothetical protein